MTRTPTLSRRFATVDPDTLKQHPENPREGDVGAIIQSVQENDQFRPVIVSTATMHILDGNHTVQALKAMNYDGVDVMFLDNLTPEQELRILVAANRTADLASYDDDALVRALTKLVETDAGLEGTGFDGDDLDDLLRDVYPDTAYQVDEDGRYTRRVDSPIYEPSDDPPADPAVLYDTTKTDELLAAIQDHRLPEPVAQFLTAAAHRHTIFKYNLIADYYANAPQDVQRLMEESALVIIDFDRAVELAFVKLVQDVNESFLEDHPDS